MKFTVKVPVESAVGYQFFTVEAKDAKSALAKFKTNGGEFEYEEIEVQNLGDPSQVWPKEEGENTHDADAHPLPKPKFTDRERAAWDWLHGRGIRGWLVDLVTKGVSDTKGEHASLIEFAYFHGWDG